MLRRWFVVFALAAGSALIGANAAVAQELKGIDINLALGNPSDAKSDAKTPNNYLMDKGLFVLAYNSSTGRPNWVSWRLVKADLGNAPRPKPEPFHADPTLPEGFTTIGKGAYKDTGFDEGHMCPDADRSLNADIQKQTFVMTNMVPQSPELNRVSWKSLEEKCRKLAAAGKELFIVAGPSLETGGTGLLEKKGAENTEVNADKIDNGRVVVPAQCWKVVLILEPGDSPPAKRITLDTQVIAVIMGNDQTKKKWEDCQVTVAEVEQKTKLKFFNAPGLPADVIEVLKKKAPQQARLRDAFPPVWGAALFKRPVELAVAR